MFLYAIFPRVIVFRIRELAEAKGILTAYQLQMAMNLPPMTASRWWKNPEMKHIDTDSLDRLCAFFECEPGDILVRVADVEQSRQKTTPGGQRSSRSSKKYGRQ